MSDRGPGVAPVRRTRAAWRTGALAVIAGLGLALAGCGGTTGLPGTPQRSAATPPATVTAPASPADPAPAASPGSPGASGAATPRPTAWPGNAVLGIEALGVADNEIRQAIVDFSQGVEQEDLALMRRAAAGLAGVEVLKPNVDRIDIFPPMQPMAARYRDVLPRIADAARRLRDAIDEGNAEEITAASRDLTAALTDYAEVQPELAGWVNESIEQRRLLLR